MLKMLSKKRNQKGFTLIELVVVIAILGILAAIAIPRFSKVTDSANDKAAGADQRIVVSAIQMYQADKNGELPTEDVDITPYISGTAIPSTVSIDYGPPIIVSATSESGNDIDDVTVD